MRKLVFLDTETTSLDTRFGDLWEIATIVRDPQKPEMGDQESWWQVRPDLSNADPIAAQIGNYYKRSQVISRPVGWAVELAAADVALDRPTRLNLSGKPAKAGDVVMSGAATALANWLACELDGATIVANNPRHDRDFIEKFLRMNGQVLTAHHRMLNVRDLLIGYVDGRLSLTGGDVDKAFELEISPCVTDWLEGAADSPAWEIVGVHQEPATRHTALGDVRLVRAVHDAIRCRR